MKIEIESANNGWIIKTKKETKVFHDLELLLNYVTFTLKGFLYG